MKEVLEIRINQDFAHLLFDDCEGKNLGTSVRIVSITKEDSRYLQIPNIAKKIKRKYGRGFYFGWEIKRTYTKKELLDTNLFRIVVKTTFEPAGEECGTEYDETVACRICGANRKQSGPLHLRKSSIPKKDIARTIAGEVIVSRAFKEACESYSLKGLHFEQVYSRNRPIDYFQLGAVSTKLVLTDKTIAGIDPFDLSESCEGEVYKCPEGHTIGLNLLSELYIKDFRNAEVPDFFETEQKIGVKRGLLRPEALLLCTPNFRKMVLNEKLKGFGFEIAHIEQG